MGIRLRHIFNDIMKQKHRDSILLGQERTTTAEEFFGFTAAEVEGVYTHKKGEGAGVWFRLRCGRVVNEVAMSTCTDPDLYSQCLAIAASAW